MKAASEAEPLTSLRTTGEKLSPALRAAVLAVGESAVPELLEILEDEDLAMEDGPGEGWAPIHAVDLLAALKAGAAIEPMLRILVTSSSDEILNTRIAFRLPDFGPAAVEPILSTLEETEDPEARSSLCCVLAQLGVRDDRIFEAIGDLFDSDPTMGAICFADYGDARALPLLEDAIACFEPDTDSVIGIMGLADLMEAHESLGGTLPDDLHAHVQALGEAWMARRKAGPAEPAGRQGPKLGRNDPCHCGSGKKYKKCCLDKVEP